MTVAPPAERPRARAAVWIVVGALGWAWLVGLAGTLLATTPPTAGFDLELLLDAARRVAAGESPYDPAVMAGAVPEAQSLFYSYPPPVAQILAPIAGLPSGLVLLLWGVGASTAATAVCLRVARRFGARGPALTIALPVAALLPFVFPFAIGLVFGNLDVWFPALYGLLLLGAVAPQRGVARAGGAAVAIASIAKLHPASLGAWLVARAVAAPGARDRASARAAAVGALLTAAAVVSASLLVGGLGPWLDYLSVVRAGSGADLLDPRNAGPAVQLGLLLGWDEAGVRLAHAAVAVGAVALTVVAAARVRDTAESVAWAAVASMVTLPVTWFHYPSALIPFGVAALARSRSRPRETRRRTVALVAAAVVLGIVGIAVLPLMWVAVGCLLAALRVSRDPDTAT